MIVLSHLQFASLLMLAGVFIASVVRSLGHASMMTMQKTYALTVSERKKITVKNQRAERIWGH
jgi:cytochrome oxidase Cu insertion factor (SCO1/SenC/PrrC family)